MKRLIIFLLVTFPTFGQSVPVAIHNPSFESALVGNGGTILGWKVREAPGGGYGVVQWTNAPNGQNVAFLAYGTSMSQDLGIAPQAGVYTLTFYVANWFYSYPADYVVVITEGTKTLCSTSGLAQGDFTQITLVCPVSGYISNNDKWWSSPGNMILSIGQSPIPNLRGWPLLVDDFSLTFTPVN